MAALRAVREPATLQRVYFHASSGTRFGHRTE
jgi:hypothetical protein